MMLHKLGDCGTGLEKKSVESVLQFFGAKLKMNSQRVLGVELTPPCGRVPILAFLGDREEDKGKPTLRDEAPIEPCQMRG